jgi:hypothetical protein
LGVPVVETVLRLASPSPANVTNSTPLSIGTIAAASGM